MAVHVVDSQTGEREVFDPADSDAVSLYYCGLTTSDPAHLGHARGWVHVDVMRRWLEYRGYTVHHVENFTDVNEKIVARIGEAGGSEAAVADTYIERSLRDMRSLNLERATVYPRVSEHITEIIDLVERLLEANHAYEVDGSVYFDVSTFPDYGRLSNQRVEDIEPETPETAEKRHPADFALWKAGPVAPEDANEHRTDSLAPLEEPAGQTWESPWGEGRPGWHIECSAMSMTHLGETVDIHVGGGDLVFPHHENEIAQSEAATGERFARHWLHVRPLELGAEKMSSSLGNFVTVEAAVAEHGADAVRTFLLSTAHDSRATYSEATLEESVARWSRLSGARERAVAAADSADAATKATDDALRTAVTDAREAFETAMDDGFNTREALAALSELAGATNRHLDRAEYDYRGLRRAVEAFDELGGEVLGFAFDAAGTRRTEELVELVLDLRETERNRENYERADELRDRLETLGVEVNDTDDGTEYRL